MKRAAAVRWLAVTAASAVSLGSWAFLAPAALADNGVTVLSQSTYVDTIGYRHIVGEVQNSGTVNIEFTQFNFSFYDASGRLLSTDSTFATVNRIAPAERSPFNEMFKAPAGYDHYTFTISASTAAAPPNHNFTTQVTNEFADSSGSRHIVGTIRNDNSTADDFVEAVFTFYDQTGTAVNEDVTFVNGNSSSTVEPGQTSSFEEIVSRSAPAYSRYAILTQSDTAAAPTSPSPSPSSAPSASPTATASASPSSSGSASPSPTGSASPTASPTLPASPTPSPTAQQAQVTRIAGATRVATANAVSRATFSQAGSAGAVVLARSDGYADALAGAPLAADMIGPLLITSPSSLDTSVQQELQRVLPSGGTVYLLGGSSALSPAVEESIKSLGYTPNRLAGSNRFGTAVLIAQTVGPTAIYEATGLNFPDALSGAAAAAATNGVVVLTNGAQQSGDTAAYLRQHPDLPRRALGGPACQADPAATCISGSDRYDTAVKVAEAFFGNSPQTVGIATGSNYPDALSAGVLLGAGRNAPLLLVGHSAPLPSAVSSYVRNLHANTGLAFGGPSALDDSTLAALQQALNAQGP